MQGPFLTFELKNHFDFSNFMLLFLCVQKGHLMATIDIIRHCECAMAKCQNHMYVGTIIWSFKMIF